MGFVSDIFSGAADAVSSVADAVVGGIEDVASAVDTTVRDVIPGGWGGVAAGALLAVGITDPSLLAAADAGTLSSEAITAAGLDPAVVATDVAAVTPEAAAAAEEAAAAQAAAEQAAAAQAAADEAAAAQAAADQAAAAETATTPGAISPTDITPPAGETGSIPQSTPMTEDLPATTSTGTTVTNPDGSVTQTFDDGSTLTTHPNGEVTSTPATDTTPQVDASGNRLPTPQTKDKAPVSEGKAIPGTNNTLGDKTPSLAQGVKDLAGALVDKAGVSGLVTAGLLGSQLLGGGKPISQGGTGYGPIHYTPPDTSGIRQPITNVGVSPGFIVPQPMYHPTSPVGSEFYWGRHPYMQVPEDINYYNQVPGAPVVPWGIQQGPAPIDINQIVNNAINPTATATPVRS